MEVTYKKAESNDEIRNWVVLHGGKPAIIDDQDVKMDEPGLRIDWPGQKDESMLSEGRKVTKDISWEEFFAIMERHNLDFMYSEQEEINNTWSYKFENKYPVEE